MTERIPVPARCRAASMRTRWLVLGVAALGLPDAAHAQRVEVASPSGLTRVVVEVGDSLTWSVEHAGEMVLAPSPLSLSLTDRTLGPGATVAGSETRTVDRTVEPIVPEKNARVRDHFEELSLEMEGGWGLVVRAYDTGVAYRFRTALQDSVTVVSEQATFRFGGDPVAVFGADSLWMSHQEPLYQRVSLDTLAPGTKGLVPLLLEVPSGPRLVVLESALEGYPGMHLEATGDGAVVGAFPPFALGEDASDVENVAVARAAPWIARTGGTRDYPWRILAVAPDDRSLLENQLVYLLASELRIQDPSWIRPGKVAWDWWNDWNFHDVDFRAGINQRTYQEYIDFAGEYGLDYVILDLGWSPLDDLTTPSGDIDVPALVEYGAARDVGIILWALWKPLDRDMEAVLDLWASWGVKGTKVDYMQRDDQALVEFYWRLAREAAERRLIVDYHGAYKPAGLRRAYPNVLSREGVRGLEFNKWSGDVTPGHDVTLPFTRMVAGPMDYTPGAMINAQPRDHRPVFAHPMSQGTRAHQMAMYVVFESPIQMLADNPQHYRREPDVTRFIASVPTTWDETRPLLGATGDYVAVARRKGDTWWVGALTDEQDRTLTLDLTFLGAGPFEAEIFRDGINADRQGSDVAHERRTLRTGAPIEVRLAPGGGWAARLAPPTPDG